MSKKNLYQRLRDGLVGIDETMPEIRQIWCGMRDAVWACVRFTAIGAVLIIGAGAWLGVYAMMHSAYAATYDIVADVPAGSARMCGRADPVLDLKVPAPADGSSVYEWRERWRVATCSGHNPAISCPAGLMQWHHQRGGGDEQHGATYRDYTCYDLSVPPIPDGIGEPALRPCYDEAGQPCGGIADQWNGKWYGTWYPGWPPPFCPPHLTLRDKGGNPPGRRVFSCS